MAGAHPYEKGYGRYYDSTASHVNNLRTELSMRWKVLSIGAVAQQTTIELVERLCTQSFLEPEAFLMAPPQRLPPLLALPHQPLPLIDHALLLFNL